MEYFSHFLAQARTALAAVRQWPISNRFAIHNQVIAVSDRNRAAIRAFLRSPFGRRFNASAAQPAARSIPANRHAQGCNFSFGDGHAEHWKWRVPKFVKERLAPQPVPDAELPDYRRMQEGYRQRWD